MSKKKSKQKLPKAIKWTIGILAGLVVLAAVFCGLYFGVPEVHDFINGVEPAVEEAVETTANLIA